MKRLLILCAAALTIVGCSQQKMQMGDGASVMPMRLVIEDMNKPFDLNMDIDTFSLTELTVLENAFAARVGYPFRDAFTRGIYQKTSWYDSLMWDFDEVREGVFDSTYKQKEGEGYRDSYYNSILSAAVPMTKEEQAFVERVRERETELLKHNFDTSEGLRVNMRNVINAVQMLHFPDSLQWALAKNGFAIVPADHNQLFNVYEENDYQNLPNFVTTDLFLQAFHLYFDSAIRQVEEQYLNSLLGLIIDGMGKSLQKMWQETEDNVSREFISRDIAFFDIAKSLLMGKTIVTIEARRDLIEKELGKVMAAEDDFSDFIEDERPVKATFAYSLFRPRGHYTRTEKLQRYFRAMMWMQSVPFGVDSNTQLMHAIVMAKALNKSPETRANYDKLNAVLTFLMGNPDNIALNQVASLPEATVANGSPLVNPDQLKSLRAQLNAIGDRQTRIRPKYLRTSRNKVCVMPQRYQPDAEVMQEMVDYDSEESLRPVPEGLDILAAMGVAPAEKLLKDKGLEWDGFEKALDRMKNRMDSINWNQTIANRWLSALKTVNEKNDSMPYFMLTPEWDIKNMNTALASWAELKHDAILYAKQPMGAECGGAGPPDPVVKGYVEPNTDFWRKAMSLLEETEKVLKRNGMMPEKLQNVTTMLREDVLMMQRISEKELRGEPLKEEEYDQIEHVGARYENISLEMVREPDQWLMGWDDVQGPDKRVALVADVYTANADNNPNKSILYAATGLADQIYLVVEVEGRLWLMRGAVMSYREFQQPLGEQRLNDEEWQEMLKSNPRKGVPTWMEPVTVPLKEMPKADDEYFYSTGC